MPFTLSIHIHSSQDGDKDIGDDDGAAANKKTKRGSNRRDIVTKGLSSGLGAFLLVGLSGRQEATASSSAATEKLKEDYDTYAADYDVLDGGPLSKWLGLEAARSELIQQAKGRVLEVAVGTGLNLQYYTPVLSQIKSIDAIDVSAGMIKEVRERERLFC